MKSNSKSKSKYIFTALYCTCFLGAGIIGSLSNSFFAYNAFNSLWATVLYLIFICALFVIAYVQEVFASRKVSNIIINSFVFIGCLIFFLLLFCLSGLFTFLAVFYSAAMMVLILCTVIIEVKRDKNPKLDTKQFFCALALLLFTMLQMFSIEFADDSHLIWSLIPAAVIFCASGLTVFLLLRKEWSKILKTKYIAKRRAVFCFILGFVFAFAYSFTAMGIANYVFDASEPVALECVVLDMHIHSGARTLTRFEIKVNLKGKEEWISVPVTEYHNIAEQDTVIIDYYSGALNFAYYTYRGKI